MPDAWIPCFVLGHGLYASQWGTVFNRAVKVLNKPGFSRRGQFFDRNHYFHRRRECRLHIRPGTDKSAADRIS